MRKFAYLRCSTDDQEPVNQILEIEKRGYTIEPHRVISEIVSGGVMAMKRPKFKEMVEHKLERGDELIVLKLDRLGRNAIDIETTIKDLADRGIDVICLDIGKINLSDPAGALFVRLLSAFAQFEKDRIIERTKEGMARAKSEGKQVTRPKNWEAIKKVHELRKDHSLNEVADIIGMSRSQVMRLQKESYDEACKHAND